jgi:hypothetical protein
MARGAQPYWLPDHKDWAVQQERQRHNQALYAYGEYVMFALLWHLPDYEAGLVDRCPKCFVAGGEVAEAFGQPVREHCDSCFGTTFGTDVRALVVRPAIVDIEAEHASVDEGRRGAYETANITVQTTADVRIRNGDYMIRANNDRYRLSVPAYTPLKTGFQVETTGRQATAYSFGEAVLEDRSSVAYDIPPKEDATVLSILDNPPNGYPRLPESFASVERINGPLVV